MTELPTIKEITDFYFSMYDTLFIKAECWLGLPGKFKTYTKETFEKDFQDWFNNPVARVSFEPLYVIYNTGIWERKTPYLLNILYLPIEE